MFYLVNLYPESYEHSNRPAHRSYIDSLYSRIEDRMVVKFSKLRTLYRAKLEDSHKYRCLPFSSYIADPDPHQCRAIRQEWDICDHRAAIWIRPRSVPLHVSGCLGHSHASQHVT